MSHDGIAGVGTRARAAAGRARRLGLVCAACAVLVPARALAQAGPRVGLALSGGAARALAHIGVLQVLAQAGVPVDVVAGTSMGGVLGGLYAAGYSAAQLDTIATTVDWTALLTDRVERRDLPVERKRAEDRYLVTLPMYAGAIHLPKSVAAGQRISELLASLTWSADSVQDFRRLPTPFAVVATDLETGGAVVLDHGVFADAVRASAALPSVFAPVEVEGRVLIDGGVVRNLPAEDARALGADVLICSDVTDPLEPRDSIRSFVDVLVQAVSFRIWDSESAERARCDVLITPDVRAYSTFGFDRASEVIARGAAAARAALPEIEAALARAREARALQVSTPRPPRPPRPPRVEPESLRVTLVRFDRPGRAPRGFLDGALGVRAPAWVSRRALDAGIGRLYATGLFETVRYRLDPVPGGTPEERELTVLLRERSGGRFGLGLRYDSRYKASVLLSSTIGAVAGFGLSGEVDARLGQQIHLAAGASQPLGDGRAATLGAGVDYIRSPFDLYAAGRRVAQARVDLGSVTASVARSLGTAAQVSARIKAEEARWGLDVSAFDSAAILRTFFSAAGVLDVDTFDRGVFPKRGVGLRAVSEWGNRLGGDGGGPFSHQFAELQGFLPLLRTVSLWGALSVGASGGEPPPHYAFFLGGANAYYLFRDRDLPFVGFGTQELRGRHMQKVEAGVQWEFVPDVFGRVRWNAGNVYQRWTWDPAGWVDGAGVELGAKTVAGRVSLSLSGRGHSTSPLVELDLGYPF